MQQQPCTRWPPNHQLCHWNPHQVQVLHPTANSPHSAFCELTLFTSGLATIPGTNGIASERLLPGPKPHFWCHLGPQNTVRSFFTAFPPKLGPVQLNVESLCVVTTPQSIQSCITGTSTQQQPCTPTGPQITRFATGIPTRSRFSTPRPTHPTMLSVS